jgi:hypothetical protein
VDGSVHKARAGGEGTGPSPVARSKLGWKWSIATDAAGIPIGWVGAGATLDTVATHGLLADLGTLHLDRGYDSQWIRAGCAARGLGDLVIAERKRKNRPRSTKPRRVKIPLGLRWPVERTNSWLSNYGQMRRNTKPLRRAPGGPDGSGHRLDLDRQTHRLAESLDPGPTAYPLTL